MSGAPLSSRALVGLLADPDRRRVVAAMILGAVTIDDIGGQTGLTAREVVDAVHRLQQAGLVEAGDGPHYVLLAEAFQMAARAEAPPPRPSAFEDEPFDRRRVLDQALRDGRLVRMPAKHAHRLVVLDHLAQRFEPGERYSERQVNAMLVEVDPDTAMLRRYLVDEAILDRSGGEYWRIGGSFRVD